MQGNTLNAYLAVSGQYQQMVGAIFQDTPVIFQKNLPLTDQCDDTSVICQIAGKFQQISQTLSHRCFFCSFHRTLPVFIIQSMGFFRSLCFPQENQRKPENHLFAHIIIHVIVFDIFCQQDSVAFNTRMHQIRVITGFFRVGAFIADGTGIGGQCITSPGILR